MADTQEKLSNIESLAHQIEQNADGAPVPTDLATSQRIIARVTDGIYREPWASFRELIANAYDADATRVIVETGAPDFEQVIIRDDGNGMTPRTVAYILKSIGGSSKRTHSGSDYNTVSGVNVELSPNGRPLIGKIGIGLFAVAQLTQHFQIITKSADSKLRISATIRLKTHDEERLSEDDKDEYVAGDVSITSEKVVDKDAQTHGTTIVLYSLRPEIRRNLQSYSRWRISKDPGPDGKPVREAPTFHIGALPDQIPGFKEGINEQLPWKSSDGPLEKFTSLMRAAADISDRSRSPANLEHFDEYLKLIWRLSLALPLKYPQQHPFDFSGKSNMFFYSIGEKDLTIKELHLSQNQTLRDKLKFDSTDEPEGGPFSVFIDNVDLRRPIFLPEKLRRESRISKPMLLVGKVNNAFSKGELERAGGQLSFEAYLYWNSKIIPKETSGVLIRVREASGTLFDRSFLDYQTSEQNRLSQITAEIFVTDGLDSAINIDRESFNYSHPHFLFIQKWLHRAIRLLINKNKGLAKVNLDEERALHKTILQQVRVNAALKIWDEHKGEDSDPPVPLPEMKNLPAEVGGLEIDWGKQGEINDNATASAIAIVLEAYGVLSQLNSTDRSRLVRDLIKVMEDIYG